MSTINKPHEFSPNTTASSSQVNDNFDTIYNEFNGSISAANLASNAVTTAKITDSNVTTAKIADTAVTAAKTNFGGDYTTSEVDTGFTWVDGKTIYKKTVSTGALPNATTKNVAHGITGYQNFIDISGWSTNGTVFTPLPYAPSGGTVPQVAVLVAINGDNITLETTTNRSAYTVSYVTLYYTKT